MHKNKRKIIYGILLLAVIALNLYLTLQPPEDTVKLSESFRLWLEQFGLYNDPLIIRSNAHLVVFFILGLFLTLFGQNIGWKWWKIILVGAVIGLFDEGIKIFLPTREFDIIDLAKDCIGILAGLVVITIIKKQTKENKQ